MSQAPPGRFSMSGNPLMVIPCATASSLAAVTMRPWLLADDAKCCRDERRAGLAGTGCAARVGRIASFAGDFGEGWITPEFRVRLRAAVLHGSAGWCLDLDGIGRLCLPDLGFLPCRSRPMLLAVIASPSSGTG
jgi:hypothetical protein